MAVQAVTYAFQLVYRIFQQPSGPIIPRSTQNDWLGEFDKKAA
jgi:hypothetical protein